MKRVKLIWLLLFAFLGMICTLTVAGCMRNRNRAVNEMIFFVSAKGNDNNPGSIHSPLRTIRAAKEKIKLLNKTMTSDITVFFREGTYTLNETLRFDDTDSGFNGFTVNYKAYNNEKVVISGGKQVAGWEKYDNKLFRAKINGIDIIRALYVNDKVCKMASTDSAVWGSRYYEENGKYEGIVIPSDTIGKLSNPEDIECWWSISFRTMLLKVEDVFELNKEETVLKMRQPDYFLENNIQDMYAGFRPSPITGFLIVNAFELLDTPGEFYFNRKEGFVYYYPRIDEDMKTAQVYVPVLKEFIWIKGSDLDRKVSNITFEGLTFAHAANFYSDRNSLSIKQAMVLERGNLEDQDLNINGAAQLLIQGNIQLYAANNISFKNNIFYGLGSVGIGIYDGATNTNITGNAFYDIGDGAITIGTPSEDFIENFPGGFDIAHGKKIRSSCNRKWHKSTLTDGSKLHDWRELAMEDQNCFVDIDLGQEVYIDKIHIYAALAYEVEHTRKNIEVILSKDEDFQDCIVAKKVCEHEEPLLNGKFQISCGDIIESYRYIRIRKTDVGGLGFGDISVVTKDFGQKRTKELSSNTNIFNNYITRIGLQNYATAAITSFFTENLSIVHNHIADVPYSAISLGYGWDFCKDSTTCRGGKVNNNLIEGCMQKSMDGAGVYMLGNQPDSVISGNYIKDSKNAMGGIYPDDGAQFFQITDNVIENVTYTLHAWTSTTKHINMKNNYVTTTENVMAAAFSGIQNNILFISGNPPEGAIKIIENAGVTEDNRQIYKNVPYPKYVYSEKLEDFTNAINFYDVKTLGKYYVIPYIAEAKTLLRITEKEPFSGHRISLLRQELDAAVQEAEESLEIENDKPKIINLRLKIRKSINKFINSKEIKEINAYECPIQNSW